MKEKLTGLFRKYKEIIMYLIFGVATTLVNWVVTFICQKVFGLDSAGIQTTAANAIAWFCAVLFAFVTNRKYVFEGSGKLWFELLKFYAARIFTGLFEIFLPDALVALGNKSNALGFLSKQFLSIQGGIAKLITCVIVIVLNYILSKLVVFRKQKINKD